MSNQLCVHHHTNFFLYEWPAQTQPWEYSSNFINNHLSYDKAAAVAHPSVSCCSDAELRDRLYSSHAQIEDQLLVVVQV